MSHVDTSRREFLRFGGLFRRVRERVEEVRHEPGPPPADPGEGTPFVGPEPAPPWARRRDAGTPATRKTRFAQVRRPACLAHGGSACSVCAEQCPLPGVITLADGRPRIDADACDGCGVCAEVCPSPAEAIVMIPYFDGGTA